jgi:hypothetical protein
MSKTPTCDEINERIAKAVGWSYENDLCEVPIRSDGVILIQPTETSAFEYVDLCDSGDIAYTIAAADELVRADRLLSWELFPTGAIVEWLVRYPSGQDDVFEADLVRVNRGHIPTHAHRLALALYRALEMRK